VDFLKPPDYLRIKYAVFCFQKLLKINNAGNNSQKLIGLSGVLSVWTTQKIPIICRRTKRAGTPKGLAGFFATSTPTTAL
jgi:hypothetical protein